VQPWVFQFKRHAAWRGFEGFNGFPGFPGSPGSSDGTLSGTKPRPADDNVIDVTPKEIK
jgi:hypothetical protein